MSELPNAVVAHRSERRLRLRFPEKKGDADFFTAIETGVLALDGVMAATARPATGSLIIRHKATFDDVIADSEQAGLFQISREEDLHRPETEALAWTKELETAVSDVSGGQLDLRAVAALALLLMVVVQMARGKIAVPATTALWYALWLLLSNPSAGPFPHGMGDGG